MKIKFTGADVNPDVSLNLVDDLVKENIITNRDEQILGIYDNEIHLDGVLPSEELSTLLEMYPGWKITTDPSETDAFVPEEGLPDVDKIGTVPDPNYPTEDTNDNLENIELFPESETTFSEKTGKKHNVNSSNNMSKRKNFDDPTLTPEGVAVEATETEVVETQEKDDQNFNPDAGGFDGQDVAPFTDEEIDKANDVEVDSNDGEITVFSDEEIEEMIDPDQIEQIAEEMEQEETSFADRKKRLFTAKRRLRKVNSKRAARKSFSDELTDSEKSDIIEDIVAILEDAPDIKEAVVTEVGEFETPAKEEETFNEETPAEEVVVETPVEEVETPTEEQVVVESEETPAEVTEEVTVETPAEPETETEETEETEMDIDAFSDDEIEEAPETEVAEVTEEVETPVDPETEIEEAPAEEVEEQVEEGEEIGRVFCKAFSNDSVKDYRHQMIAEMSQKQSSHNFNRR